MNSVEDAIKAVEELRKRVSCLDEDAIDLLFREARTHNVWTDRPVTDKQINTLYDLTINGATSGNCLPARLVFCRSHEAKARLTPCVNPGNVKKIETAPLCVIIGYDVNFWEHLPRLFPHRDMATQYREDAEHAETNAFRNSTLQAAYLMLGARALGMDIGAMSGFNNSAVDNEFFSGTTIKSNFLCNIGYGDPSGLFQKLPRFKFDEVCTVI
tara:strand:+ start:38 stop:676 length:639 start_codon:yes stop_codon:yes gene_type:complete